MNLPTPSPRFAASLYGLLALLATPALSAPAGTRSVEDIVAELNEPTTASAVDEARVFDERLTSSGEFDGVHVRVITDSRLARVTGVTAHLLRSAGRDPAGWSVRVLDTDPTIINACVAGGGYVYVFTGLLAQDPTDDELAFIVAHALGHSLLAHEERRGKDVTMSTPVVTGLPTLLPAGHEMNPVGFQPTAIPSTFSPEDEQEADALATCIAHGAGFNAVRGADYCSRLRQAQETRESERRGRLAAAQRNVDQAVASCERGREEFRNASRDVPRNELAAMTASCNQAKTLQDDYDRKVTEYNSTLAEERRIVLLTAHPKTPSRTAAIAAVEDVLAGRTQLSKLGNHEEAQRVLMALQQSGSGLAGPGGAPHE